MPHGAPAVAQGSDLGVKCAGFGLIQKSARHGEVEAQRRSALAQLLVAEQHGIERIEESFFADAVRQEKHAKHGGVIALGVWWIQGSSATGEQRLPRGGTRDAARQHRFREIGKWIGDAVKDDFRMLRAEPKRVAHGERRHGDAEPRAAEQAVRERALHPRPLLRQPVAEPGGVPVVYEVPEERTTQQHHKPVAIQRGAFPRRGHIVKGIDAIAKPAPDRFQAIAQQQRGLAKTERADVFHVFGKAGIYVVALDGVEGRRARVESSSAAAAALARPSSLAARLFPPVAAEAAQHQLHHVALAVVRGRGVGKDKELHRAEEVRRRSRISRPR